MDLLREYGKIPWTYFDRWRKFMFLSRPVMKAGTREGGFQLLVYSTSTTKQTEPVFLNVYEAQELIPRNEFRQPM
jgi:hypothetical protein